MLGLSIVACSQYMLPVPSAFLWYCACPSQWPSEVVAGVVAIGTFMSFTRQGCSLSRCCVWVAKALPFLQGQAISLTGAVLGDYTAQQTWVTLGSQWLRDVGHKKLVPCLKVGLTLYFMVQFMSSLWVRGKLDPSWDHFLTQACHLPLPSLPTLP